MSTSQKQGGYLNWLTDIPVLKIASHLNAKDLANFSYSCKNLYNICQRDGKIWKAALERESPEYCQEFRNMAESIFERQTLIATDNVAKLALLMYNRTEQNWAWGKNVAMKIIKYERCKLYVHNFSSYLVSLGGHATDIETISSLNILDLRTGLTKEIRVDTVPTSEMEVALFNDCLICYSTSPDADFYAYVYLGFKLDMEKGILNQVWRNHHPAITHFSFKPPNPDNKMFQNFYVMLNRTTDPDGNEVYFIEGFSNEDGSKLFHHRYYDILTDLSYHIAFCAGCNDDSGWFVYLDTEQLLAVNYKNNSIKSLKNQVNNDNSNIHMVIKYQKLICVFDCSDVELFDLPSGTMLHSIKAITCDWADFDNHNNITTVYLDKEWKRITIKVFDQKQERTVTNYPLGAVSLIHEGFVFNSWVCFETSYPMLVENTLTRATLSGVKHNIVIKDQRCVRPARVHPFFIALDAFRIGPDRNCSSRILDFLQLRKYLE